MVGQTGQTDEVARAEVTTLIGRSGLELSAAEIEALVEPYRRQNEGIAALRADLDPTEEPGNTFDPR